MNIKMLLIAAALAAISAATYFGLEAAFPKKSEQSRMEQKTSQRGPAGNEQTARIVADAAARAARETAQQVASQTARDTLNGGNSGQ